MAPLPLILLLSLLCIAVPQSLAAAAQPAAVSVDDTSPLVTYDDINKWTTHVNVAASYGLYDSSDTFSSVQGAWASFSFNGTSIEYWGNQGPYHGPCLVELEDGTSQTVNSHYTVDAVPILLFSKYGLSPSQTHKIKVTVVDPSYPNVCEVDRFVYTPLPTATTSKSSSNSVKFIAIGAAVGAAFLLAVVFGCFFFWKRRHRRSGSGYNGGRGVLDEDLPTASQPAESGVISPFVPRPTSSQTGFLSTEGLSHHSHNPSILSSLSNAKAIEARQVATNSIHTPFHYRQPPYNPHLSFPASTASGSYQAGSDERSGAMSVPADSSVSYSGEGSSAAYSPLTVQNHSAELPPGAAPSSSLAFAPHQPIPVMPVIASVPSAAPFQHQDAGRVPDEIPPAYKDSWNPAS